MIMRELYVYLIALDPSSGLIGHTMLSRQDGASFGYAEHSEEVVARVRIKLRRLFHPRPIPKGIRLQWAPLVDAKPVPLDDHTMQGFPVLDRPNESTTFLIP